MRENKSIILYYRWLFLIFVQISWTKSSMKSWVFINNLLHTSGLKSSVNCYCNCNVSRWISISLLTLLPKFLECVKSFILDINWRYLPTLGNGVLPFVWKKVLENTTRGDGDPEEKYWIFFRGAEGSEEENPIFFRGITINPEWYFPILFFRQRVITIIFCEWCFIY